MSEFQLAANSYPVWKAILWCFYPIGIVVSIEVFLRSLNDDDDDDQGGGVMTPVYQGAAA
tara:strand:- start:323 stop:502 length:180 start_codon:yes stop_codon:yes gene_type:complete